MYTANQGQQIKSAELWLSNLERAIEADDSSQLRAVFLGQSYWRDVLAMTWEIQTYCSSESIINRLGPALRDAGAVNFQLDRSKPIPKLVTRVNTEKLRPFSGLKQKLVSAPVLSAFVQIRHRTIFQRRGRF